MKQLLQNAPFLFRLTYDRYTGSNTTPFPPRRKTFPLGYLLSGFLALSVALPAEMQTVKKAPTPNRIRPQVVVLSAAWSTQIPPTGRVNAPQHLPDLYPGQKISLAIVTEGPDRDHLLDGVEVSAQFISPNHRVVEERNFKLLTRRQIKAQGADMVIAVLNAAGLSGKDHDSLADSTSLVTFSIYQADWIVPTGEHTEDIQIITTLSGPSPTVTIEPLIIKIRSTADWLKEPPMTKQEAGKFMSRYHEDVPPGRLLNLLQTAANDGSIRSPSVFGFFVHAYKYSPASRNAVAAVFPNLDQKTQDALLFVLRLGNQDITALLPTVSADTIAKFNTIDPLKDPRKLLSFSDPIDPQSVKEVGVIMDQCWSGWMATGDPSYLRALVQLLSAGPDFPAFQSWTKQKGGIKGLNASVARGLAYQIAGWSIGSFRRTDPHVTDWLLFWENDPTTPEVLKHELKNLPFNPAFRRE